MQPQSTQGTTGLRLITPGLRTAEKWADLWCGLPDGASKSQLLQLLEDIPASRFGVPVKAWQLLHRLVKRQPQACFLTQSELHGRDLTTAGLALISTWSDDVLGEDLDRSSRSLARYRGDLAAAGLIAFRDSPDRSRAFFGKDRDAPDDAYGVDLKPLVARYSELCAIRDGLRQIKSESVGIRRSLSRARNRLRELKALMVEPSDHLIADQALKVVDAVRRRKDIDAVQLGLQHANEAVARLEASFDLMLKDVLSEPDVSGAPDSLNTQLPPSVSPQPIREEGLGEEGTWFEAPALSSNDTNASTPISVKAVENGILASFVDQDDVVSDDVANEGRVLFEFTLDASAPPRQPLQRVTCPELSSVIGLLPKLMGRLGFSFSHDTRFKDDESLVIAYGQAAASRIGFDKATIVRFTTQYGVRFAVAALLTEGTKSVENPKSYLEGILYKLGSGWMKVDLAMSWGRLTRHYLTASPPPSPRYR